MAMQWLAIALGGASGAVLRFLVATGVTQQLGRDFPYGTLAVNVIGSFLLGLLTEGLLVQRTFLAFDYRAAILIGFIGAFTTFSTFSLDTVYLVQQGNIEKALLNIALSVGSCLLMIALGLKCGQYLALLDLAYRIVLLNAIGALLIGCLSAWLLPKAAIDPLYKWLLLLIIVGLYVLSAGFYGLLTQVEQQALETTITSELLWLNFIINTVVILWVLGLSYWLTLYLLNNVTQS
jgi:CrcB protein